MTRNVSRARFSAFLMIGAIAGLLFHSGVSSADSCTDTCAATCQEDQACTVDCLHDCVEGGDEGLQGRTGEEEELFSRQSGPRQYICCGNVRSSPCPENQLCGGDGGRIRQ
jgi:hypothetical protein